MRQLNATTNTTQSNITKVLKTLAYGKFPIHLTLKTNLLVSATRLFSKSNRISMLMQFEASVPTRDYACLKMLPPGLVDITLFTQILDLYKNNDF